MTKQKLCKKHGGKNTTKECFECRVNARAMGAANRMAAEILGGDSHD